MKAAKSRLGPGTETLHSICNLRGKLDVLWHFGATLICNMRAELERKQKKMRYRIAKHVLSLTFKAQIRPFLLLFSLYEICD